MRAVTCPCQFSPRPSAFPMTKTKAKKISEMIYQTSTLLGDKINTMYFKEMKLTYYIPLFLHLVIPLLGNVRANELDIACKMLDQTAVLSSIHSKE